MSIHALHSYLYFFILGAFYHLTSPIHPCRVTSSENSTVDLLCQYKEGVVTSEEGGQQVCTNQEAVWQRADFHLPNEYHLATNISNTKKYAVWEAVPGWRMAEGQRVSLLRIRNVQPEDVGLYQCRIRCTATTGQSYTDHHMADLCLEHHTPGKSICSPPGMDNKCAWSFANDVCNSECDNEENLYDGFDCAPRPDACADGRTDQCRLSGFADGVCNQQCDSSACAWDGGDCITRPLVFARNTVVITVAQWYHASSRKVIDIKALGRTLSLLLRTIVRVLPDDTPQLIPGQSRLSTGPEAAWHKPDQRGYLSMRRFYLKIDNTMCLGRCFHTAEYAAQFIDQALKGRWNPGIPISAVGVLSTTTNRCELENNTLLHFDLPISSQKEGRPHIYSPTYTETANSAAPTWLLICAVIGGLLILALLLVIIIIVLRIRKLSKEERHRVAIEQDPDRIQDKNAPPHGTDV